MYVLDQFFTISFFIVVPIIEMQQTHAVLKIFSLFNSNLIHFLKIFLLVNFYRYSLKFGEETFSYVLTPPQTFSIKRRPV